MRLDDGTGPQDCTGDGQVFIQNTVASRDFLIIRRLWISLMLYYPCLIGLLRFVIDFILQSSVSLRYTSGHLSFTAYIHDHALDLDLDLDLDMELVEHSKASARDTAGAAN